MTPAGAQLDIDGVVRTLRDRLIPAIATFAMLTPSLALAQPLPQPKPLGPGGSCPHGYTSSGSFCVRREGAQDAIPKPPNGTCPAIAPSSSGGGEPAPKSTSFRSIPRRSTCDRNGLHSCTFPDG